MIPLDPSRCAVEGVLVLEFYMNGVPAETISGVEVRPNSIYIPRPTHAHVGVVTCQLPGTEIRAYGSINGPPRAALPAVTMGTVNLEITLECETGFADPPMVIWYNEEVQMTRGSRLTFRPSYRQNDTRIRCVAENAFGMATAETRLLLDHLRIINKVGSYMLT